MKPPRGESQSVSQSVITPAVGRHSPSVSQTCGRSSDQINEMRATKTELGTDTGNSLANGTAFDDARRAVHSPAVGRRQTPRSCQMRACHSLMNFLIASFLRPLQSMHLQAPLSRPQISMTRAAIRLQLDHEGTCDRDVADFHRRRVRNQILRIAGANDDRLLEEVEDLLASSVRTPIHQALDPKTTRDEDTLSDESESVCYLVGETDEGAHTVVCHSMPEEASSSYSGMIEHCEVLDDGGYVCVTRMDFSI